MFGRSGVGDGLDGTVKLLGCGGMWIWKIVGDENADRHRLVLTVQGPSISCGILV
jgi:hypothetical protein